MSVCCICTREMRSGTKVQWAVDSVTLRVLGQAHKKHAYEHGGPHLAPASYSQERAQRHAFAYRTPYPPDRPSQLADDLVAAGDEAEERLKWWREGPMQLTESQEDEVKALREIKEAEFRRLVALAQEPEHGR